MQILGIEYPNINSKLKGKYAKRINVSDLEDVVKQNNFKSAILLLKSKDEKFKNIDESIDRLEIEQMLEEQLIESIKEISKLLNNKDEEEFREFLQIYEIKCIKSIFRKLFSKEQNTPNITERVKKWSEEIFDELKGLDSVENFDDFFNMIKRTRYSKFFKQIEEKENINSLEIENSLDKIYFEKMYDKAKSINLKKMIGSEVDLLNVSWIYRMKKYYNFDEEAIKKNLINRNYKLNSNIIEKMIYSKSYADIKEILKNTVYIATLGEKEEYFEQNIDKFLYKVNKKIFKTDIRSINYIFAFINLLDYENNDIVNVIEGIRYGIDKKEIIARVASF